MKNLAELAAEANKYHADVESQDRTALEAAWHAGQALKKPLCLSSWRMILSVCRRPTKT